MTCAQHEVLDASRTTNCRFATVCHLTLQCRASLLSCLEMRCLLQQQDAHERRAGAMSWYVPTRVKGQRVGAELPGAPPSSAGMQRHPFAFHVHLQGWCRLCRQQGAARMHCLRTMMVMHSACFQGDSCHDTSQYSVCTGQVPALPQKYNVQCWQRCQVCWV